MNQEIKAKWVAALRSGEYKQTDGYLHRDGCFCVMGVLCDLYIKQRGISWERGESGTTELYGSCAIPPHIVTDWAGLESQYPNVKTEVKGTMSIVNMNDRLVPFKVLADIIEKDL